MVLTEAGFVLPDKTWPGDYFKKFQLLQLIEQCLMQ
jgi:hypothetical protein